MSHLQRHSVRAGFTLVEVMITLAIMVLVVSVGLVNFRQSDNRSAGIFAAQQLVGDLRLVASKSMSGDTFQGQSPTGWGISLSEGSTYVIFADLDGDRRYDDGVDVDYKEKFKSLSPDKNTSFDSSADIFFDAYAHPYNDGVAVTTVTGDISISVKNRDGIGLATISVNPLGAVSVQN